MNSKKEFVENIDYYLEDGRVHFTKEYLLDKPACCGNFCRHCPFSKNEKGNKKLRQEE